jgi:hypothetical protein
LNVINLLFHIMTYQKSLSHSNSRVFFLGETTITASSIRHAPRIQHCLHPSSQTPQYHLSSPILHHPFQILLALLGYSQMPASTQELPSHPHLIFDPPLGCCKSRSYKQIRMPAVGFADISRTEREVLCCRLSPLPLPS